MPQLKIKILLGLVAVLFVSVLYLLYLNLHKSEPDIYSPLPTPAIPTSVPTQKLNLSITPTPTVKITKVKIQNTSSWVSYSCGPISFKLPANYTPVCEEANSDSYGVRYGEDGKNYGAGISINKYDGGSRRQYWINLMQASPSSVLKYVRFQESQYGSVIGLDVFASGGWWQGGFASAILIANNKTLVSIHGYQDFNDQENKIVRDPIADTIASTIKFNSVATTSYKTYRSDKYGISFNYPQNAEIMGDLNSHLFSITSGGQSVSFLVYNNPQKYSVSELFLRNISPTNPDSIRQYITFTNETFNNNNFVLVKQNPQYFSQQSQALNGYHIGKGEFGFSFNFHESSEPLVKEIISSFVFINQ